MTWWEAIRAFWNRPYALWGYYLTRVEMRRRKKEEELRKVIHILHPAGGTWCGITLGRVRASEDRDKANCSKCIGLHEGHQAGWSK